MTDKTLEGIKFILLRAQIREVDSTKKTTTTSNSYGQSNTRYFFEDVNDFIAELQKKHGLPRNQIESDSMGYAISFIKADFGNVIKIYCVLGEKSDMKDTKWGKDFCVTLKKKNKSITEIYRTIRRVKDGIMSQMAAKGFIDCFYPVERGRAVDHRRTLDREREATINRRNK